MTELGRLDPVKVQQMATGYEERIENQKRSITRLQTYLEDRDHTIARLQREAKDAEYRDESQRKRIIELSKLLEEERAKASQLAAEASNMKGLIDAHNATAEPPTDPHSAPVEWDRRVPEKPSGPTESTSDEVLAFDAWSQPAMPLGEERPSPII